MTREIRDLITDYVTQAVPDDLDLWPAIAAQVTARRHGWLRLVIPMRHVVRSPVVRPISAALLLGALLLLAGLPWLSREQSSVSAAGLLNTLAEVAAAQPATAQPGYRYIKAETMWLSMIGGVGSHAATIAALIPKTRELWVAPDGSGRIRETAQAPIFLSERTRAAWEAAGKPELVHAINQDFGPGGLLFEDFSRYPTDPTALADVIRQRAEQADPPIDIEMFIVVGDILREPGVPPELRAALYKVAARIPGVELLGPVTDRAGRAGVAVAKTTDYWGGKQRFVLIFDPKTSALLGEERVLLERVSWLDAEPPVVIGSATYLESGIVPSLPAEPPDLSTTPAPVIRPTPFPQLRPPSPR